MGGLIIHFDGTIESYSCGFGKIIMGFMEGSGYYHPKELLSCHDFW